MLDDHSFPDDLGSVITDVRLVHGMLHVDTGRVEVGEALVERLQTFHQRHRIGGV